MYRLLFFIASLLISLSGFAQTPNDSIQQVRKAQVEKARAAARAKAEAKAAERAKMEAERNHADKGVVPHEPQNQKDPHRGSKDPRRENADKNRDLRRGREREDVRKERLKQEVRKEQANETSKTAVAKGDPKKEEKPKKPSIKERNMADTAVAKSKYGPGTFGLKGNIGATIVWSDYSNRKDKIGFDSWGFVLNGGMGYRFNHIGYVGVLMEVEAIELIAFSPMLDFVVTAPTPVSPFVELTAGPYISYDDYRKWVFQPRVGLSYRGKQNKIMRFGFGLRMYDDAFDAETFKPQYAASYTVEF